MKGIILAGGSGTRLYPITLSVCKQLLPVYDKPMIYYPLSSLMFAGIKDILIISNPEDVSKFEAIFKDGSSIGLNISYKEQPYPGGLAQAFIIGEEFIGSDDVCLILGDNIFYGHGLPDLFNQAKKTVQNEKGGVIFTYYVEDPQRYGVIELDANGFVTSIEEKPQEPKSNYAVTGIYFYDNSVIEIAKNIKPSERGELEITDVNNVYLKNKKLKAFQLGRGHAWLDTGTPESLLDAAEFIAMMEKRQGLKIGCIEEIAYRMGYIGVDNLKKAANTYNKGNYGKYLLKIINDL
ncbi:MAG: glucose-1-phosphate thymidylyltransferase [Candidatus Acididesulfobacter diazotrophicus]|jgi:glucose-1-phosphate thymidylyltransferase|uniref:Glucose-1-phosphate thymidylyltransferase n=1 Tax=Candidatus Acididesulfobacter diazotrophicus TaxID=2597226 RepID=A0A519BKE9_9DELT|nr:MAG: glucose-1-phosphate thymidylyltransferase [Candidatus Acididesulfobacter diazotrophicus]